MRGLKGGSKLGLRENSSPTPFWPPPDPLWTPSGCEIALPFPSRAGPSGRRRSGWPRRGW
eukprot:1181992-Prorocentrum_minimum.AAC.1